MVGADTRVATGRQTNRDAISELDKRFLFFAATRTAVGRNQHPIRVVLGQCGRDY